MIENDAIATLSTVHRQLSDALFRLDLAGRHAAAAHLAAAIELVEADIDFFTGICPEATPESPVTVIARRMIRDFGARAETVARRQLATATGPAMLAWAAIINRIVE